MMAGGALSVLVFAAVLFYTTSSSGTQSGNSPVVVAARDISIRVPIQPGDLMIAEYHSGDVPPNAFTRISDINNDVAAVDIAKGQPLTSNILLSTTDTVIGPQSAFLPIPSGYVAITIPTGEQQGVAGNIQVGDYISLVGAVAGKTSTNVRTIFVNISVIRVGTAPSTTTPVQGNPSAPPQRGGIANSLTIIATECQSEYIAWFLANGSLRYTLESYHDYAAQATQPDPTCPAVTAAKGVTQTDIAARWPGIFS